MSERLLVGTLITHPQTISLMGEFIVRWSLAEMTLIMPLLVALDSHNQDVAASVLSSTNSTEGKIKIVRSAVQTMNDRFSRREGVLKVLSRFEKLCPERNLLLHHVWAYEEVNQQIVTIDYRKPPDHPGRVTTRSLESLIDLCNHIALISAEICAASGSSWITEEAVKGWRLEISGRADVARS